MAHHIHTIFSFNNEYETLVDFSNDVTLLTDNPTPDNRQMQPLLLHWKPCRILWNLYDRFQNNILTQWPCIACVYCGKLLYPEKASWTFYDPSITYPCNNTYQTSLCPSTPTLTGSLNWEFLLVTLARNLWRDSPFLTSLLYRKRSIRYHFTKGNTCLPFTYTVPWEEPPIVTLTQNIEFWPAQ